MSDISLPRGSMFKGNGLFDPARMGEAARVRLGILISTLGGLLFTLDLPLLRLAGSDRWTIVWARGICLFLSISLLWFMSRRGRTPYIAGAAGLAVVATAAIGNISFIGALFHTNAANIVFVTALIPIITALMSFLFLGEKVHGITWLATLTSIVGVLFIVSDGIGNGQIAGDLMALVAAICSSAAFVIVRASGKNVATSLGLGNLLAALIAMLLFEVSPASLLNAAGLGVPGWVWIVLNGLVAIPLASTLLANGPRYLPSVDVSMFFLLETVFTPFWIWLLFYEAPSLSVFVGGMIVIATVALHSSWRLIISNRTPVAAEAP